MTTFRWKDHILGPDTHANRPAATGVSEAAIYECTTHGLIYKSVSGSWVTYGALIPPGGTTGQALVKNSSTNGDVSWGSSGGASLGDHGARVKKDATQQSISNGTVTALTWQTSNWDTDSFWSSGASTKFTVPSGMTGKYLVGASFTLDAATAFDQLISLGVNGTEFESCRFRANAAGILIRTTTVLSLAAADYVEAFAYQSSGSSKSTPARANAAEFWIQRVA